MEEYSLQPNESIIMKSNNVLYYTGFMSKHTDDMILTNINIILVKKGSFGNIKDIYKFPINQIKIFNGNVQALMSKESGGYPKLEIYFVNGQEVFGFQSKKEIKIWINNLDNLVSGNLDNLDMARDNDDNSLLFEPIKETVDEFINVIDGFVGTLGLKKRKENKSISNEIHNSVQENEKSTIKCYACGAPLAKKNGKIAKCMYCDTEQ